MTREGFHDSLERIELELLTMGELSSTAVQRAVQALVERDEDMAQAVIDGDDPIDDLYLNIDHSILELLALQSPVAADLRLVSAILHSCLHLERIADQAVNVAKLFLVTKTEPGSQTMRQQISEMGGIVVDMVRTAMEAFARRDLALCMTAPGDGRPRRQAEPEHAPRGTEARGRSAEPGLGPAHEHGGTRP